MSRIRKLTAAVVLGLVAFVGSAGSAPAQLGLRVGYGVNPYSGFGYPGWYSGVNVTLGGVGSGYLYNFSVLRPGGATPFAGLPQYYANSSAGLSGLYGAGYSGYEGSRIVDRQRSAIQEAQRNAQWDQGMAKAAPNLERFLNEQARPVDAKNPNPGPKLNPALINPTEEAILRGDVLNELAALVTDLEGKGKRAEAGLCAPDLMSKVVFSGGGAADAANQFRTAELTFPAPLTTIEFDPVRTALERAYTPVATAAYGGKRVSAAEADKLLAEIAKAREAAGKLVKEGAVNDARAVSAFFNRLESATKFAKDPNAVGVAGTKWSAFGVKVDELVRHMNKFKTHFGMAASGDEAAYYSLHRGLLAYYAALAQAK